MSKYLVRPSDYMVWVLNEGLDLYEIIDQPTDRFGNKPIPYDHFTKENLIGHGFFQIGEELVEYYNKKRDEYHRQLSEEMRGDGHGDGHD
jgi:hypothetical protein